MKANEAPEKIYLQDSMSTDTIGELWPEWFDAEFSDYSIEYTRSDVFIKKACEWLKKQNEMIGISFQEDFIERFKNYMKGE